MAKGTDSNEFMVHSRVRTGLKREFAFAMKAQSEIDGSLGRTRGGSKNRNEPPVRVSPVGKRAKKTGSGKVVEDVGGGGLSEEEAKSDVVDLGSDDEPKNLESVFETVIDEKTVLGEALKDDKAMHEMEIEIESVKLNVSETLETLEEPKEEECSLDVKGGNVKKKKVALEKPVRRFTRSALKEKEEETKVLDDIVVGIDDDVEKEETEVLPVMATLMPRKLNKSSKRFPIKLKDLLATGILDGLKVKYIKGQKVLFDFFDLVLLVNDV